MEPIESHRSRQPSSFARSCSHARLRDYKHHPFYIALSTSRSSSYLLLHCYSESLPTRVGNFRISLLGLDSLSHTNSLLHTNAYLPLLETITFAHKYPPTYPWRQPIPHTNTLHELTSPLILGKSDHRKPVRSASPATKSPLLSLGLLLTISHSHNVLDKEKPGAVCRYQVQHLLPSKQPVPER